MTIAASDVSPASSHRAVMQMIGHTLHLGRTDGLQPFWGLAVVLRSKLTPFERQGLAWAALMACDDDEAAVISKTVLGTAETHAGWPMVPFEDLVSEATFWADHASLAELRAYAGVCLSRLSERQGRAA